MKTFPQGIHACRRGDLIHPLPRGRARRHHPGSSIVSLKRLIVNSTTPPGSSRQVSISVMKVALGNCLNSCFARLRASERDNRKVARNTSSTLRLLIPSARSRGVFIFCKPLSPQTIHWSAVGFESKDLFRRRNKETVTSRSHASVIDPAPAVRRPQCVPPVAPMTPFRSISRPLLPKVIRAAENFRSPTNHFDCAGRASLPSRDRAGIDHAYDSNRNSHCSEYWYSSCSRSGRLSLGRARLTPRKWGLSYSSLFSLRFPQ
jgi:hypothetical protein